MSTKSNEVTLEPKYDLAPTPDPKKKLAVRRPTKFTPSVKRKILVALQMGQFPATAAAYAGISESTLVHWLQRGKMAGGDAEGVELELYEFAEQCMEARAKAKVGLVAILWRHSREDGHVAIKLLEKLFPEEYGRKVTQEVKGKIEHEHKRADFSKFTDEELEQAEALARKAQMERLKDQAIDAEIIE